MALNEIEFSPLAKQLPKHVARYLEQMEPRIDQFRINTSQAFRGFVPSDYVAFYWALAHIQDQRLACGNSFCEWGSGLGVATCLASMLGFESSGIEIDEELSIAAERFVEEFAIPVQLVRGSFLPSDGDDLVDDAFAANDGCVSMFAHADDAYGQLGCEPQDFDLIYAFPWPNDEELVADMFERFASTGALLLTYNENTKFRLQRK